jgi:hypothetical protein
MLRESMMIDKAQATNHLLDVFFHQVLRPRAKYLMHLFVVDASYVFVTCPSEIETKLPHIPILSSLEVGCREKM